MKGKVSFKEIDGVCITADFGGKRIEDYAMAWLKLTNVARESSAILKIANNSKNDVYVYCAKKDKKRICDFLTDIVTVTNRTETRMEFYTVGKVESVYDMKIAVPCYEYPDDPADADKEYAVEFTEMTFW